MAKGSKTTHTVDMNVKGGPGTKKTALEMKNLGRQTDKVSKSTAEANRNWKGASAQSSGASKNFSKMSQGMGGIVGAYATLAANIFAVGAAFRFLQSAGDLEKLKEGQVLYASATGTALKSLTNDIIAATDAQVTFTDASQSAAIGKAAGMSNDQLVKLGKGAKDVSIILGRDVTDSFNRLVRGVTKAEPELLDELGIILRLADASEKYGASIGKTADQLTQYEKSQAVTVEVLDQLESKYGRIMAVMAPSGNEFTKLGKAFDDIVNQIKVFASFVAGPIAETLTRMPMLIIGLLISMGNQLLKTGLAAWASGAKERADELAMGYAHAQAKLEDLQRAQQKRSDSVAQDVNTRGKKLKAPETRGKVAKGGFEMVAKGQADKLTAIQRRAMKGVIDRSKKMTGEMKNHWYKLLNDVKLKNKTTTRDINFIWQQSYGFLKVQGQRFAAGFAGTMAVVKGAAAATGVFISKALGIISMISMVSTLAISAFQWFKNAGKAKDATEDMVDEMDVATEKVKSLNEEFEKFNAVQRIIVEDGQGFLQFFEAMGNRIGQLSISMSETMFEGVREGFSAGLEKTDADIERIMDRMAKRASRGIPWIQPGDDFGTLEQTMLNLEGVLIRMKDESQDYWEGDEGGFTVFAAGTEEWTEKLEETKIALANVNAMMEQSTLAAEGYRGNLIAFMKGGFGGEDFTEFGEYLQEQLDATQIASEAFGNAKNPVTNYLAVLNELTDLTPADVGTDIWDKLIERLMAAQVGAQGFAASIANAGRMATENLQETNKILMDIQKRSTEGRLADTLGLERDARDATAGTYAQGGYGGAPSGMQGEELETWVARGLEIERHIELMTLLDEMKAEAKKRTLETALEERKMLQGTTKLVAQRLKLEIQEMKNKDKIADIDAEILAIRKKVEDTGIMEDQQRRMVENHLLEKEILAEQNIELERKLDYTMQIADAASQEFESGLQKSFKAFIKGENNSLTEAIRGMAEGVFDAIADTLANQMTEMVMGALGFKTEAEKIKEAMDAAADRHAQILESIEIGGANAKARQQEEVDASVASIMHNREYEPNTAAIAAQAEAQSRIEEEARAQLEEGAAALEEIIAAHERERIEIENNRNIRINALIEEGEHLQKVRDLRREAEARQEAQLVAMSGGEKSTPYVSPDLSTLPPELRGKVEEATSPSRFLMTQNTPIPVTIAAAPKLGILATARVTSDPVEQPNFGGMKPGFIETWTGDTGKTEMPQWVQDAGGWDDRPVELLAAELAFYKAATTRGSIFTHDTHVVDALKQMGATGITSQSDITGVGSFGTGNAKPEGQELADLYMNKMGPKQGEKKGMFAGIIDPFKKLFTDDSPWMTKLGDFFGGESSFLSGLSGIFGGMGDIFGQLMGGAGGGGFMSLLSLVGMANGGVIKGGFRKYANGGIATSPTLGMVGEGKHNEAIVPLPNGRAIPVDMRSSAQNNNVTVNVSSTGQTQTEGQDNEGLGNAIAKAVQEELQNQKRAGGILNRYGTA